MALKNKEGWLYFLGEIDFKTGERYQYVKIGKTDYDRPVSDGLMTTKQATQD